MAKYIKTDGSITEVHPANRKDFKLDELKKFVEGYIEIIPISVGEILVMNEEGKLLDLEFNSAASSMVENHIGLFDIIVGNVLLCKTEEVE